MPGREAAVVNQVTTLEYEFRQGDALSLVDPFVITKVEILQSDLTVIQTIVAPNIVQDAVGKYHVDAAAVATAQTLIDRITFREVDGGPLFTKTGTFIVQPVAAAADAAMLDKVKRRLGLGKVNIELTNDALNDALEEAKIWIAGYAPVGNHVEVTLVNGTTEYVLPVDCTSVHDVLWGEDPFVFNDPAKDPFVLQHLESLYGGQSGHVERMMNLETGQRIAGADPQWHYRDYDRTLIVYPPADERGLCRVRYASKTVNLASLHPKMWLFTFKMTLALAKQTLGRILRKYPSLPGAGGDFSMDGETLMSEGLEEQRALDEKIGEHAFDLPLVLMG